MLGYIIIFGFVAVAHLVITTIRDTYEKVRKPEAVAGDLGATIELAWLKAEKIVDELGCDQDWVGASPTRRIDRQEMIKTYAARIISKTPISDPESYGLDAKATQEQIAAALARRAIG